MIKRLATVPPVTVSVVISCTIVGPFLGGLENHPASLQKSWNANGMLNNHRVKQDDFVHL